MKFRFSLRTLVIIFPLLFAIGWGTNLLDAHIYYTKDYKDFQFRVWRVGVDINSYQSHLWWAKQWLYMQNNETKYTKIGWPSRNLYPDYCRLVSIRRYDKNAGTPLRPCGDYYLDIVLPF